MTFRTLFTSLSVLAVASAVGCSVEIGGPGDSAEQHAVERGPIGKADMWGSCAAASQQQQAQGGASDHCGGQSTGNCWCDEQCADFGDCCADKVDVCGQACPDANDPAVHYVGDAQTCMVIRYVCEEGQEPFGGACGCGCIDVEPAGDACGGLLGLSCDEGEFCAYAADAYCGAADQTGICTPRPEVCIELYKPVCGCDGLTYGNSCKAASAGMSVVSEGECEAPPIPNNCPEEGCGEGMFCSPCWGSFECIPDGAAC